MSGAGGSLALHRRPAGPAVAMLRCLGPPPAPSGPGLHPLPSPVGEWVGFRHLDPAHRVTRAPLVRSGGVLVRGPRGAQPAALGGQRVQTQLQQSGPTTQWAAPAEGTARACTATVMTPDILEHWKRRRRREEQEGEDGEEQEEKEGEANTAWHHMAQPSD